MQEATPTQLSKIEIPGAGTGLDWPELDAQHCDPGLLRGVVGNRRWMAEIGRAGGLSTSAAKAEAARRNGAGVGRPKSATVPAAAELASALR